MTVRVVDPLQAVQVGEQQQDVGPSSVRVVQLVLGQQVVATPVEQVGQVVRDGELRQLLPVLFHFGEQSLPLRLVRLAVRDVEDRAENSRAPVGLDQLGAERHPPKVRVAGE